MSQDTTPPQPAPERDMLYAPFEPLGYSRDSLYLWLEATGKAFCVDRRDGAVKNSLLVIAPLSYWMEHFKIERKGKHPTYDREAAADHVIQACYEKGEISHRDYLAWAQNPSELAGEVLRTRGEQ